MHDEKLIGEIAAVLDKYTPYAGASGLRVDVEFLAMAINTPDAEGLARKALMRAGFTQAPETWITGEGKKGISDVTGPDRFLDRVEEASNRWA